MIEITKDTIIGNILDIAPQTAPIFFSIGMHCLGCVMASGENLEQACAVHGEWIRLFWKDGTYSKAAHAALGEMYAVDPRFRAYYEKQIGEGAAEFLRDALAVYAQTENMQN